ncbi:hypothetical protein P67b_00002 [Ruegeria phage Tedan]|nr:hypothetical protein P67b_00002 [Ruegeria phage Tedan]
MTFQTDEQSIQDGSPVELFKFTGTYNTYRLTNWGRDVTNTDGLYSADFAISRTEVEGGTQEDDDIHIDIELDASHPLINEYVIQQPPPGLRLEVFRAHPANFDDTFKLWDGEATSWSVSGRIARVRVPSLFSFVFDSPLPRPKFQAPCNHVFGDARCTVDLTSAENNHDTTISSINGRTIVVASNPFPVGELNAGQLIAPSERRMIVSSSGTTVQLASTLSPAVAVGDSVSLRRGCGHAFQQDCVTRFNNGINFGGYPLVPARNPFSGRF